MANRIMLAIIAVLTLVDSSLIAHQAAAELSRERALLRRGFVPQVAAEQVFCEPRACAEAPLCRWLGEVPLGQAGRLQATLLEVSEL